MQADQIPDEIMREARKLAKPFHAWDELEQRIARALLARDKRAAEIARKAFSHRLPGGNQIATAIVTYGGRDE